MFHSTLAFLCMLLSFFFLKSRARRGFRGIWPSLRNYWSFPWFSSFLLSCEWDIIFLRPVYKFFFLFFGALEWSVFSLFFISSKDCSWGGVFFTKINENFVKKRFWIFWRGSYYFTLLVGKKWSACLRSEWYKLTKYLHLMFLILLFLGTYYRIFIHLLISLLCVHSLLIYNTFI